jgi:chitinase
MALHHRSPAICLLLAVAALLLSLQLAFSLNPYGGDDVAVYWGRNKDEGSLREACDTGAYTTVIISFLAAFGHGQYRLDLSGHRTDAVGADIDHCKGQGVLVLLAIGGQGGEYSLPSAQSAADLADYLWNAFLAGRRAGVRRPFGEAQVDGVDFFIDQGATEYYDELAKHLYAYNKNYRAWGITLTATPRCRFPDQRLEKALATGLFNRIHVRLYGEDRKCVASPREAWERWAAAYPGSRVFVGVVASPESAAAPAGYMSQKDLYHGVLRFAQKRQNYGGLMIWNRYYDNKTGYLAGL